MRNEIKSLTGLRGLAAFYVVIYHWLSVDPLFTGRTSMWGNGWPFINHGYLAVDVFFILSGFVIALSSKKKFDRRFSWLDYKLFLTKRLIRIYPVYILAIISAFYFLDFEHDRSYKILVESSLFLQVFLSDRYILGPTWSLCTEWIAYLLFPLLIRLVYEHDEKYWNWFLFTGILGALVVVGYINHPLLHLKDFIIRSNSNMRFDIVRGPAAIIRCLCGFTTGIIIYRIYSHGLNLTRWSVPIAVACLISLCFSQLDLLFICLVPLLILSISHDKGYVADLFKSPFVYYLGEISYSVYLLHVFFIFYRQDLGVLLKNMNIPYASIVSLIMMIALMFVSSALSYQFIEKKFRNWLTKYLVPRQPL